MGKCSHPKCLKWYDVEDMFFDFIGSYYLCPKCLLSDYRYHYQTAIKLGKLPKEVKIQTGKSYPFQDLVNFFKNWCYCCANRIGEEDGFEMKKGARICPSCVATNVEIMSNMVQCITCEGFIHNQKEIFQIMGD